VPRYLRPRTLDEALSLRADTAGATPLTLLAGGTDVYPVRTQRSAWFEAYSRDVLDLSLIPELGGITREASGIRLGAMATWSAVAEAELPTGLSMLKQASRQVGGVQIQNRGTVGGNLCNASPAADGVPPLLALDALEQRLTGEAASPVLAADISGADLASLAPIDDVRASAAYRREAALVLVRRALSELFSSPLEVAA
jgi:CO/xanthine dehydrogenase FAD-binding subunit